MELARGHIVSWAKDPMLRFWSPAGELIKEVAHRQIDEKLMSELRARVAQVVDRLRDRARRRLEDKRLWEVGLRVFQLPTGRILSMSECEIRLWSVEGEPTSASMRHDDLANAIELPNGSILSWSRGHGIRLREGLLDPPSDGAVRLWSREGQLIREMHEEDCDFPKGGAVSSWLPEGQSIAGLLSRQQPTIHNDEFKTWAGRVLLPSGRVLSWDRGNRDKIRLSGADQPERELKGHSAEVEGAIELSSGRILSWSHSDLWLWSGMGEPIRQLVGGEDSGWVYRAKELKGGCILCIMLDIKGSNWQPILRLWSADGEPVGEPMYGHHTVAATYRESDTVSATQLASGQILSWSSEDGTLRLWSAEAKPVGEPFRGHGAGISGVLELTSERILSWSGDKTIRLWDLQSSVARRYASSIAGAIELSIGGVLSWSDDNELQMWSSDSPLGNPMLGHSDTVSGAMELSNGYILSWSDDGTLQLWTPEPKVKRKPMLGHKDPVWGAIELSSGHILSWSKDYLRRWNAEGDPIGKPMYREEWDSRYQIFGVKELSSGRILSWGVDGYDYCEFSFWGTAGEDIAYSLGEFPYVWDVEELPSGRVLALAEGSGGSQLSLWASDGALIKTISMRYPERFTHALGLSNDTILTRSDKGAFQLWNSAGELAGEWLVEEKSGRVQTKELSSRRILSWPHEHGLRLWSLDFKSIGERMPHKNVQKALELTSGRILSWSHDELRLWSEDGHAIGEPMRDHAGETIAGVREVAGGRLLSWSTEGTFVLWDHDGQVLAHHILWFEQPLLVTESMTVVTRSQRQSSLARSS
jgi:WD40 repeat protein